MADVFLPAGTSFVALRDHPELWDRASAWFSGKWELPPEEYHRSMEEPPVRGVPGWYLLCAADGTILAGAGLIENDFHDRPDLHPNLCALYVEPAWRGRGLARFLLGALRREAGACGWQELYLITDHTGFYERCGWRFATMVETTDGERLRLYAASCPPDSY